MNRLNVYVHSGGGEGGSVRAKTAEDAAGILARRMYGKSGKVGAFRLDSMARDGSRATYEAYIGLDATEAERWRGESGVRGHNVWIYG